MKELEKVKTKKTLCVLLAMIMLLSALLPTMAFADEEYELVELFEEYDYEEPANDFIYEEIIIDDQNYSNESEEILEESVEPDNVFVVEPEGSSDAEIIPDEEIIEEDNQASKESESQAGDLSESEVYYTGAAVITSDPQDAAAAPNTYAEFSVVAENAESYQWYVSTDGGSTFKKCTSYYGDSTKATLNVEAKEARNGFWFLCKVTGGGVTVESNPAKLTVATVPVITSDPQDVTAAPGTNAEFSVVAESAPRTMAILRRPR